LDSNIRKVGCSVVVPVFKYSRGYRLPTGISIYSAELMAIYLALEWIDDVKPEDVVIFSDCMSAIGAISSFNQDNKIVCDIQRLHLSLHAQGIKVEIVWVPGHIDVFGNEWADLVAKKALDRKVVDIPVKLNKSECKSVFKKQMKKDWQKEWSKYKSTDILKIISSEIKLSMPNWKVPRDWEIQFHRLRLGKCRFLKSYLFFIGKHCDGKCDSCLCLDTVAHFLLDCRKYSNQRRSLKKNLQKVGIKNVTVEGLLGGKYPPIGEVMKFIVECKPTR
jgi:ribonuclease HI